jgi:hypothetical protein
MRPSGSSKTASDTRRAWEPPALSRLAIGTETKSSRSNAVGAESQTLGSDQPAHPQTPASPVTKLGFSFEWAFPLSARFEP